MSNVPLVEGPDDLPDAIRFAQTRPNSRWYVVRRAEALGLVASIPADWGMTASAKASADRDQKQRDEDAKSGVAMKDGSFPIRDAKDLHNAVQALGRAKNKVAAKRHIIKRAKVLGQVSSLPADWGVTASALVASDAGKAGHEVNKAFEALHPRGRDGKFITKGGSVNIFSRTDSSHPAVRGIVTGITSDVDGNPSIAVEITGLAPGASGNTNRTMIGRTIHVKPENIEEAAPEKAHLPSGEDKTPEPFMGPDHTPTPMPTAVQHPLTDPATHPSENAGSLSDPHEYANAIVEEAKTVQGENEDDGERDEDLDGQLDLVAKAFESGDTAQILDRVDHLRGMLTVGGYLDNEDLPTYDGPRDNVQPGDVPGNSTAPEEWQQAVREELAKRGMEPGEVEQDFGSNWDDWQGYAEDPKGFVDYLTSEPDGPNAEDYPISDETAAEVGNAPSAPGTPTAPGAAPMSEAQAEALVQSHLDDTESDQDPYDWASEVAANLADYSPDENELDTAVRVLAGEWDGEGGAEAPASPNPSPMPSNLPVWGPGGSMEQAANARFPDWDASPEQKQLASDLGDELAGLGLDRSKSDEAASSYVDLLGPNVAGTYSDDDAVIDQALGQYLTSGDLTEDDYNALATDVIDPQRFPAAREMIENDMEVNYDTSAPQFEGSTSDNLDFEPNAEDVPVAPEAGAEAPSANDPHGVASKVSEITGNDDPAVLDAFNAYLNKNGAPTQDQIDRSIRMAQSNYSGSRLRVDPVSAKQMGETRGAHATAYDQPIEARPIGSPAQYGFGGYEVVSVSPDGSTGGFGALFRDKESAQAYVDAYNEAKAKNMAQVRAARDERIRTNIAGKSPAEMQQLITDRERDNSFLDTNDPTDAARLAENNRDIEVVREAMLGQSNQLAPGNGIGPDTNAPTVPRNLDTGEVAEPQTPPATRPSRAASTQHLDENGNATRPISTSIASNRLRLAGHTSAGGQGRGEGFRAQRAGDGVAVELRGDTSRARQQEVADMFTQLGYDAVPTTDGGVMVNNRRPNRTETPSAPTAPVAPAASSDEGVRRATDSQKQLIANAVTMYGSDRRQWPAQALTDAAAMGDAQAYEAYRSDVRERIRRAGPSTANRLRIEMGQVTRKYNQASGQRLIPQAGTPSTPQSHPALVPAADLRHAPGDLNMAAQDLRVEAYDVVDKKINDMGGRTEGGGNHMYDNGDGTWTLSGVIGNIEGNTEYEYKLGYDANGKPVFQMEKFTEGDRGAPPGYASALEGYLRQQGFKPGDPVPAGKA